MMICSPEAAFHITHVHKRWYNDIYSNLQDEPYYVAMRFSKNYLQYQSAELMGDNTNKLFTPIADLRNERKKDINERKLYGELWGVDLLTELQEDVLVDSSDNDDSETRSNDNNDSDDNEDDKENDQLAEISLQNSKRCKAKGRPKSSKRIKRSEELKPAPSKRQNQCENCVDYGHYWPRCPKK
ncbi:hypothetical protein C2G38_2050159 [Gigaspora rosea]|uniref:CCHC-type domain-containing protein n=1 Tax=Gigaspora rosea TaxID=44941 RepID=A0A397U4I0_9GLOM|nr:hypothetical protein C2G38_2050159 [Gigaspora rosea]